MTKKNLFLILFAICLATVYAIWFSDWFKPKTLGIFHTSRNLAMNRARGGEVTGLIFGLTHAAPFKELKVVPLDAYQTNKEAAPLWHLVSDSNSVPVKIFYYGQYIRGMHPAIKGMRPVMPETNVMYRLLVTSGNIKAQHDFELQ